MSMKGPESTTNACRLCAPLGASLVFKGFRNMIPLLHGSQGCATYVRRYLISHFREPVDIASSSFSEETAIFGGGKNLKDGLANVISAYAPEAVGIASTCLSETIGDDVRLILQEYRDERKEKDLPPIIQVSTPSYRGSHVEGFHDTVLAVVAGLAGKNTGTVDGIDGRPRLNFFPGMVSPADLRYFKEILADFGVRAVLFPDYSETLDGGIWKEWRQFPSGGTPIGEVIAAGEANFSIEAGRVLAERGKSGKESAGSFLQENFTVPLYRTGLPVGVRESDRFFRVLSEITGKPVPEKYIAERGRLLDACVDAHKYLFGKKAVVYGEEDLVVGIAAFLFELGIEPCLCASGNAGSAFIGALQSVFPDGIPDGTKILADADFALIEEEAAACRPDILLGSSKGSRLARKLDIPLVRTGFPVHDRFGGGRILHAGYRGTLQLLDRIVNGFLEKSQSDSEIGYSYL